MSGDEKKSEWFGNTLLKHVITAVVTLFATNYVTSMMLHKEADKEKTEIHNNSQVASEKINQNFTEIINDSQTKIKSLEERLSRYENNNSNNSVNSASFVPASSQPSSAASASGHWTVSTGDAQLQLFPNSSATVSGVGAMELMMGGSGTYSQNGNSITVTIINATYMGESMGQLTYQLQLLSNNLLSGTANSSIGQFPIVFYRN